MAVNPRDRYAAAGAMMPRTGETFARLRIFALAIGLFLGGGGPPMIGVGPESPVIGVTPSSLGADLFTGERTTRTLTIQNTGGSDLPFTISIQLPVASPARPPAPADLSGFARAIDPGRPKIRRLTARHQFKRLRQLCRILSPS